MIAQTASSTLASHGARAGHRNNRSQLSGILGDVLVADSVQASFLETMPSSFSIGARLVPVDSFTPGFERFAMPSYLCWGQPDRSGGVMPSTEDGSAHPDHGASRSNRSLHVVTHAHRQGVKRQPFFI